MDASVYFLKLFRSRTSREPVCHKTDAHIYRLLDF